MFWGVFSQFSGVKFGIRKCCLCKRNYKYQVWSRVQHLIWYDFVSCIRSWQCYSKYCGSKSFHFNSIYFTVWTSNWSNNSVADFVQIFFGQIVKILNVFVLRVMIGQFHPSWRHLRTATARSDQSKGHCGKILKVKRKLLKRMKWDWERSKIPRLTVFSPQEIFLCSGYLNKWTTKKLPGTRFKLVHIFLLVGISPNSNRPVLEKKYKNCVSLKSILFLSLPFWEVFCKIYVRSPFQELHCNRATFDPKEFCNLFVF